MKVGVNDSFYISESIFYCQWRERERERERERGERERAFTSFEYDNCNFVEINDLHTAYNVSVITANIRL